MATAEIENKEDDLHDLTFVCGALYDFKAVEEHDLSFQQGEVLTVTGVRSDGWWEATNGKGVTGLVPSTFFKVPDHIQPLIEGVLESEIGKKNSSSIESTSPSRQDRNSLLSSDQDMLPKGFGPSTLFEIVKKNSFYTLGNFMTPKYDGISFKDIQYEDNSLKPEKTPLQKKIKLVAAIQIQEPPNDFKVKSRHIRMCFHDGNKVLSNIHTVKATWSKSSPSLWLFNSKMTIKEPCIEDARIFVKSSKCVPTLGILFELCIGYETLKGTSGEMCAGWAFMKLLNNFLEPIGNSTNTLRVLNTEPFAPVLLSTYSQGFFKNMKDKQKLPRIVISISDPDASYNHQISYLPPCLIGPWSCIPIISLYRIMMADDLLEQGSFDSTERIQSPLLASMPRIMNEPDLMDALRASWSTLRDVEIDDIRMDRGKKEAFRDSFCQTVFIIMNSNNLPPYKFGDTSTENTRKTEIERLMKAAQDEPLALSGELEFPPLSLNMFSANLI